MDRQNGSDRAIPVQREQRDAIELRNMVCRPGMQSPIGEGLKTRHPLQTHSVHLQFQNNVISFKKPPVQKALQHNWVYCSNCYVGLTAASGTTTEIEHRYWCLSELCVQHNTVAPTCFTLSHILFAAIRNTANCSAKR